MKVQCSIAGILTHCAFWIMALPQSYSIGKLCESGLIVHRFSLFFFYRGLIRVDHQVKAEGMEELFKMLGPATNDERIRMFSDELEEGIDFYE